MLKKGKKKKEEAEKKTASDVEQQGKVSESDSAGAEANPGEIISSLIINSLIGCLLFVFLFWFF